MIMVKNFPIRDHKKVYSPGDVITTMSPAEEASLIADGYAEKVEESEGKNNAKGNSSTISAEELIKQIEASENAEELQKILVDEQTGKNRKTVIATATAKLDLLASKYDDEHSENGNNEDPSKLIGSFNANDVIVPGSQV